MTPEHDRRTDTSTLTGTPVVTVRYWAGARDAAGVAEERVSVDGTVADLLDRLVARHPGLAGVVPVCSVLVDGLAARPDTDMRAALADAAPAAVIVEILPPFAGG